MKFDKETREAIRKAVQDSMAEAMMTYEERWLTAEQLLQQFGMLSEDWLRRNAWRLPRGRFEFKDADGTVRTRWAYPQHKISQMITQEGVLGG